MTIIRGACFLLYMVYQVAEYRNPGNANNLGGVIHVQVKQKGRVRHEEFHTSPDCRSHTCFATF